LHEQPRSFDRLWTIVGCSLLAGAVVAAGRRLPERVAAIITAFGGGILVAAVAFELAPEADAEAGAGITAVCLLGGALVFVGTDALLTRDLEMMEMRRATTPRLRASPCMRRQPAASPSRPDSLLTVSPNRSLSA
jgi:peptidoglycan/LPS O-acetylase OafA/YrhL